MDADEIRLLIADADVSIRDIIQYSALEQGWLTDQARDGVTAVKLLRRNRYAVLLLDLELPVIDGLMVCEQFCVDTPVIFISRRDAEQDRLDAFAAGGNDFVVKPFYPRELVARIKSLLKLTGVFRQETSALQAGGLLIKTKSREVHVGGRPIKLTPREYELLLFLVRNQDHGYTRETLLNMVWGQQFDGNDRTVDAHIKSLREKIKPYHTYITTIWGYGYKFIVT